MKRKLYSVIIGCFVLVIHTKAQLYSSGNNVIGGSNVGIGIASPAFKLDVRGGGGGSVDIYSAGRMMTGDANGFGGIWLNGGTTDCFVGNNGTNVGFWTSGYGWGTFQIDKSNGFVGIGTTAPGSRLDVFGGGGGSVDIKTNGRMMTGDGTGNGGIWLNGGTADCFVGNAAGNVGFWTSGAGWSALQIEKATGKVLLGNVTAPNGYRLYVETGILTEKLKIALKGSANWADYVFAPGYQLKPLSEVESFIQKNRHLPGVPAADKIVAEGGLDIAPMMAKQMEKIEELTLYMIEMKKEIQQLQQQNQRLQQQITNHTKSNNE